MAAWRCANADCGAAAAPGAEWRKGWALRSGGFANLCDKCGVAYEQSVYCELFHQKESGWRQCTFCDKRVHCGCIASKSLIDLLDSGGVQCFSCMKNAEPSMVSGKVIDFLPQPPRTVIALSARSPKDKRSNDFRTSLTGNACELGSTSSDCKVDVNAVGMSKVVQLGKSIDGNGHSSFFPAKRDNYSLTGPLGHIKEEHIALLGSAFKDGIICNPAGQACMNTSSGNMNLGPMLEAVPNSAIQHMTLPLSSTFEEGRDHNTMLSALQQAQRARNVLAKPPKASHCTSSDSSKEFVSNLRVARPPGEGRGRNQLLPRYWPRITDQELQQISGDSNSTIVPLFEKVLSASDAGRIGRLVLPKACAEAYFPSISQPEGLPLKIQDVRGKEWQFQFRFWPNNNSRMYVLEGVTPCIQSLQLQAGDTVTFSRIDPEGKLVMGFRKATNSVPLQDSQISAIANGALGSEAFFSAVNESIPIVSGYSGLVQSFKGAMDPNLSCLPGHFNLADDDMSWQKTDKHGGIMLQPLIGTDKRKGSRNIGPKSKRLHMDDEDALELKLSWEEAQELLRPPPSAKPSIVMIEDHEFEEYEEPPVLGKRTIFTSRESGSLDQWIQCDDCYKWRRLPVDVLPPPRWTCSDNKMDPQRSSCSVSDELSPKELQTLLRQSADLKRWKAATSSSQNNQYPEASGLDALATVATIGELENQTTPSMATTTKHPRHRSGCSCIVCIQPPSGKGPKHSPNCECIVCLTVKRRFKTLMMRKKQRQSERGEGEAALKKISWSNSEDNEANSSLKNPPSLDYRAVTESLDSKGHIDLNFHPERDAAQRAGQLSRMSMMNLLQIANSPLETYLKQNGLTSLAGETQVSSSSLTVPHAAGESEGRTPEESCFASSAQEREVGTDEGCCGSDKAKNDPA